MNFTTLRVVNHFVIEIAKRDMWKWHLKFLDYGDNAPLLPEDVWGRRSSRKESVMAAAIICQKSELSLRRRVARPPTQLSALVETQWKWRSAAAVCGEELVGFAPLCGHCSFPFGWNSSANILQETRRFLELRCLMWLPTATGGLFSRWNVPTPNWDILIVQNKQQTLSI